MEFLLEINTEEMPVEHIKTALSQMERGIHGKLIETKTKVSKIKTYGTSRRLIVVGDFALRQTAEEEIVIGPPKSVAFLPNGSPSPAAKGFAGSQGIDVTKLEVIKSKKGEYVGFKRLKEGRATKDILVTLLPNIIHGLSFPKMMRWGEGLFKFSRPIKNVFCLFDGKLVSFEAGGIASTDFTTGHRIYFPQKIKSDTFSQYLKALKLKKVIIDPKKRKQMILSQIDKKLAPLQAQLLPDEQLMEKLTYDVEYPFVFIGEFPGKYLKLPVEVLSTAMKVGQNLFSVVKGKKQLAYFLGIADAFKDSKSLIRKGNERVLIARLEDARFFWEQDIKTTAKERYSKLGQVLFQEKLGTYEDKAQRLKKLAGYFADRLEVKQEKKQVVEAAEYCKVDLVTEMVKEFPSLQGKIGGLYTRKEGYPVSVWKAIYEHYRPVSVDDISPSSLTGTILSVVDKIDSIVGVIGVGIEVTGSKDPFGLRRNAQGVCNVILEKKLNFSFYRLLDKVIAVYENKLEKQKEAVKSYCINFFVNRMEYLFERQGFRYDLVKAVLAPGIDNIYFSYLRLKALDALKNSPQFEPLILIAKRVNNILRDYPQYKINTELLYEKEERELYTTFSIIEDNVLPLISRGDFVKAQRIIFRIKASLSKFFDNILVMAEEKRIRRNRLALLQALSKLLIRIADYSKVVVEG